MPHSDDANGFWKKEQRYVVRDSTHATSTRSDRSGQIRSFMDDSSACYIADGHKNHAVSRFFEL